MPQTLELPADPAAAVALLREASKSQPVLVFKLSPICPVSHRAEGHYRRYLRGLADDASLSVAEIDVIAQKPLARGLTAELDIRHESPQALWISNGEVTWHGSHGDLTTERFEALARGAD